MRVIILLPLLLAACPTLLAQNNTPCPVGDCTCILDKAYETAQDPETYQRALNLFFAATACDESLRPPAERGIASLFEKIKRLQESEQAARAQSERDRRRAIANQADRKLVMRNRLKLL